MKILDRYLGRIILQYTLISMMVLLGLFTFVSFLDQLGSLGKGNFDMIQAISFVLLTMPRMIYELFPMAALLGTIIGLSMLANDSELIVMRASGVSMLQITLAALKMGGLFIIVAICIGEFLAPYTETQAQRGKAEAMQENIKQHTNFGLWMRDTATYVNIGEVLPDLTLLGIKVFEFDPNNKLRTMVAADEGVFEGEAWVIRNVRHTVIKADGAAETATMNKAAWQSRVTPQILSVFLIKPDQLSFWQLNQYINHLEKINKKTDAYKLAFWNKLMLPLSTAVMVILAIPFVFSSIRSGTMGRNLFVGIMLGLGFYVAHRGFGYVVLASGLSPFLGASLPILGFLLLAIAMMKRIR